MIKAYLIAGAGAVAIASGALIYTYSQGYTHCKHGYEAMIARSRVKKVELDASRYKAAAEAATTLAEDAQRAEADNRRKLDELQAHLKSLPGTTQCVSVELLRSLSGLR